MRDVYPIDKPFVHHAESLCLDIRDLQNLCKCSQSIRECIPRRLADQSLEFDESLLGDKVLGKSRILRAKIKICPGAGGFRGKTSI